MKDYTNKTTAIALQGRRLVTVSRKGGGWRAELTDAGGHYLRHGTYPDGFRTTSRNTPVAADLAVAPPVTVADSCRSAAEPAGRSWKSAIDVQSQRLVARVIAAGGILDGAVPAAPLGRPTCSRSRGQRQYGRSAIATPRPAIGSLERSVTARRRYAATGRPLNQNTFAKHPEVRHSGVTKRRIGARPDGCHCRNQKAPGSDVAAAYRAVRLLRTSRPGLACALRLLTTCYDGCMSVNVSVRLDDRLAERLRLRARAAGESLSDRLRRYAEEGSRRDEHPLITFRDGPAGRRAAVVGGADVWEIVMWLEDLANEDDPAQVLAAEQDISRTLIDAALRYREAYSEEVEARIALHRHDTAGADAQR